MAENHGLYLPTYLLMVVQGSKVKRHVQGALFMHDKLIGSGGFTRKFTVFGRVPKIFGKGVVREKDVRRTLCKHLPKKIAQPKQKSPFWGD